MPAVNSVATQGVSHRERRPSSRGSRPSSDSCDSARAAPASGCKVPENMLSTMNQMAADLAALPNSGAKVGPSTSARSWPSGAAPRRPSQTPGSSAKNSPASKPLASMARGTAWFGLMVSPTWQAAASKAGAAKPIKYSPAIKLVNSPNQPGNGVVSAKVVARRQSTWPAKIGARPETKASSADALATGTASRVTQRMPTRLSAVNASTMATASAVTGTLGKYHCWMADADKIAVSPQVGTQPHQ